MISPILIVGLGNPGAKYEKTRHNVGFLSVEAAAEILQIRLRKPLFRQYEIGKAAVSDRRCVLVKPLTYMNRSGVILPKLMSSFRITAESLVVICDTMDLQPGTVRVRRGGGTAGHRGIASVQQEIGSSDFLRVYIGIGRPEAEVPVVDHVLGAFPDEAAMRWGIRRAGEAALALMHEPLERVMNEFNRKEAHYADN